MTISKPFNLKTFQKVPYHHRYLPNDTLYNHMPCNQKLVGTGTA